MSFKYDKLNPKVIDNLKELFLKDSKNLTGEDLKLIALSIEILEISLKEKIRIFNSKKEEK